MLKKILLLLAFYGGTQCLPGQAIELDSLKEEEANANYHMGLAYHITGKQGSGI